MARFAQPEILVVGAGPTGLTLAGELCRRGVAVRVIDAAPAPSPQSKALAIHARTLELFEKMGLVERFLAVGWKLHAFTVFDRKQQIVRMAFDELESPYPFVLSLPQFDTERILTESFTAFGGSIERNTKLTGIAEQGDFIEATIMRPDGTEESYACRWLIGCDGPHSTVRNLIDIPFIGSEYRENYVLADVGFETSLDLTENYLFSGAKGVAGFHAFSPNRARIFADLGVASAAGRAEAHAAASQNAAEEEVTLERLQAIMDERGPGTLSLVNLNWLSMHHIQRRQAESYRKGRVFLAGDAAHLHSPASGQGMNTGIQDAYNLAWKLALVDKDAADENLLDSYSPERHAVGKDILIMTDFFTRINTVRSPIAQEVRNKVGPLLALPEIVRHHYRQAVCQLAANYRASTIVHDHVDVAVGNIGDAGSVLTSLRDCFAFNSGPHAGDRAPDADVVEPIAGKPVTLFDLLRGTEHHLLLLTGTAATPAVLPSLREIAQLIAQAYGAHINVTLCAADDTVCDAHSWTGSLVYDANLSVHNKYGAQSPCLYLIRPDGYVAFRSLPANKGTLSDYLDTIFRKRRH